MFNTNIRVNNEFSFFKNSLIKKKYKGNKPIIMNHNLLEFGQILNNNWNKEDEFGKLHIKYSLLFIFSLKIFNKEIIIPYLGHIKFISKTRNICVPKEILITRYYPDVIHEELLYVPPYTEEAFKFIMDFVTEEKTSRYIPKNPLVIILPHTPESIECFLNIIEKGLLCKDLHWNEKQKLEYSTKLKKCLFEKMKKH